MVTQQTLTLSLLVRAQPWLPLLDTALLNHKVSEPQMLIRGVSRSLSSDNAISSLV